MTDHPSSTTEPKWLRASGWPWIVQTLKIAADPLKLGIALLGIVATFLVGSILDVIWAPGGGVGEDAIQQLIVSSAMNQPYEEPSGDMGIFELWREHEARCVIGVLNLGSLEPNSPGVVDRSLPALNIGSRIGYLKAGVTGVWWLVRYHFVFAIILAAASLFIWSVIGGGICRMAALQLARGEKPELGSTNDFVRRYLVGGFLLAPCIPIGFMLIVTVLLALGGMVLRIPFVGDLISGLAFPLALVGGIVLAALLVCLAAGGSLMFPTVATEGSDAFDAFSRSPAYVFHRPLKTVLYTAILLVYVAVCWFLVRLGMYLVLVCARTMVSFGTRPFGAWSREVEGSQYSKLELLWPMPGAHDWHDWPAWSNLAWYECISAVLIGIFVSLMIGLVWSFLVSFYFSGSSALYLLLRRDVDGTEIGDIYIDDDRVAAQPRAEASGDATASAKATAPSDTGTASPSQSDESDSTESNKPAGDDS